MPVSITTQRGQNRYGIKIDIVLVFITIAWKFNYRKTASFTQIYIKPLYIPFFFNSIYLSVSTFTTFIES